MTDNDVLLDTAIHPAAEGVTVTVTDGPPDPAIQEQHDRHVEYAKART